MKIVTRVIAVFMFSCLCAAVFGQSTKTTESLTSAQEKLKTLNMVTGEAVGYAASEGEFYRLSKIFLKSGKVEYYKWLLKDKNPVVRMMGLVCLAQTLSRAEFENIARSQANDNERVDYMMGCFILHATVGKIAAELVKDPNFFGSYSQSKITLKQITN